MRAEIIRALEFAQQASGETDLAELENRFSEVVAPFGVAYFAAVRLVDARGRQDGRMLFGRVNSEWTDRYAAAGYFSSDPTVKRILTTNAPFTWSDAFQKRPGSSDWQLLHEVAEATGARQGLVIPVHQCKNEVNAVLLSGPELDVSPDALPSMHLAAIYFNSIGRELLDEPSDGGPTPCRLTDRQLEVMRWVMDGKSDWEIGEILTISERTAHNHVEAAKRVLGVSTRTQAVVEACRQGWLV